MGLKTLLPIQRVNRHAITNNITKNDIQSDIKMLRGMSLATSSTPPVCLNLIMTFPSIRKHKVTSTMGSADIDANVI